MIIYYTILFFRPFQRFIFFLISPYSKLNTPFPFFFDTNIKNSFIYK